MKKLTSLSKLLGLFIAGVLSATAVAEITEIKGGSTTYSDDYWLDWKEDEVTQAPEFNMKKAIPIELNKNTQMQWYIDPDTMSLGKDNVFRYVAIAQGPSGAINAFYEGVLCKKAEIKIYARLISSDGKPPYNWRMTDNPQWKSVNDFPRAGHEKTLSKEFICDGSAIPTSVYDVKKRLKNFSYDVTTH